jgi:hypothetical protein
MIKKVTLILVLVTYSSFGQVKLWNQDRDKIKTKGTYLTIDREVQVPQPNQKVLGIFPAATAAGTVLPFVFKYGNSALKKLTAKKEEDYSSEINSVNNIAFKFNQLDNDSIFTSTLHYYLKGNSIDSIASKYSFSLKKKNNFLIISLIDSSEENYIPVKPRRKYDFIIETFEITVQAEQYVNLNDTIKKVELTNLGTAKITRHIPSFTLGIDEIINNGLVFLPKYSSSGKEIKIENIILTCKIKYLNPYGLSQSNINNFLENNSDTNEALLNTIFVEPED